MYRISPPKIYVHERALERPECVERMNRMLPAIDYEGAPEVVDDAQLNEISRIGGWSALGGHRTGELKRTGDPTLVFSTFTWPNGEELTRRQKQYPHLKGHYFLGNGAWTLRNGLATRETQLGVCTNAYELHSAWGCLHYCDYCNIGTFLHIMLNMEEYVERLEKHLDENRWCKLWKYDNHTDIPAMEPEYGGLKLLVDLFAKRNEQYLMVYTKSDNLDYLADLDHRGKALVCWTLSCETVAREIEKGAPSTAGRIRAIRLCQEAGYGVRVRFSPIFPIKDWQPENLRMLDSLFANARINLVTMDMFKWIEPRRVRDMFDVSLWDDEFLGYVDHYAQIEPQDRPRPILPNGKQVFPHDARARVYRFFIDEIRKRSPRTRVALCGETPEMWDELEPELGMNPDDYACACGPTSVPGHPMLVG